MEIPSWTAIVVTVLVAGGGLGGIVTVATLLFARIDKRDDLKRTDAAKVVTDAVEFKRVMMEAEAKDEEQFRQSYRDIVKLLKDELARAEQKISKLESGHSLSHETIAKVYQSVRAAQRKLGEIEQSIRQGKLHGALLQEIIEAQALVNDIDGALP